MYNASAAHPPPPQSAYQPGLDQQFLQFEPQVPQTREREHSGGDGVDSRFADLQINASGGRLGNNSLAPNNSGPGPTRGGATVTPKRPNPVGTAPPKGGKPADRPKDLRKSCAECRRLKAKCDRVFPCSNCRRRGCALVCPDGDLSCMQGKRLVLASTEQLHDRISQLETALYKSHSQLGVGAHPLLAPEFLDGGFASVSTPAPPPMGESSAGLPNTSPNPSSRHRSPSYTLGSNVSEDVVAHPDSEWISDRSVPAQYLPTPPMVQGSGHALAAKLSKLLSVLPLRDETRRRANRFWIESGWYQYILQRDEFENIYEPAVYAPTPSNPLSPHKLACVLMVLVLDSFLDLTRETDDPKVTIYWDAVQECFDTRFGWAASVAGVQALGLMTYFVGFGWKGARASNFYWLRRMTTATQQLGMHKDPHPSIPHREAELRRRVFHESFVIDGLVSMNHGHRNAIPIENIECRYPSESSRLTVRYDYMRNINNVILDFGLRPDSIAASPEEIQALEDMISNFDPSRIPQHHCPALSGAPFPDPPPSIIRDKDLSPNEVLTIAITANSMTVQKSVLFLHRPALRRLIRNLRTNPNPEWSDLDDKIATKTFEACRNVRTCAKYFARSQPLLAGRAWTTWTQLFSAAVSMAAVALWCSPHMDPSFLTQAYLELNETRIMIDESGSDRARGVHALVPLLQETVAARYPHLIGQEEPHINHEAEDMIFALLGGAVDQHGPGMLIPEHPVPPAQTVSQTSNAPAYQDVLQMPVPPRKSNGDVNLTPPALPDDRSIPANLMMGGQQQQPQQAQPPQPQQLHQQQQHPPQQPQHPQHHQQPQPQQQQSQPGYPYGMGTSYLGFNQQEQAHAQSHSGQSHATPPHAAPVSTQPHSQQSRLEPQPQPPQAQPGVGLPYGTHTGRVPGAPAAAPPATGAPAPDSQISSTEIWAQLQTFYEPTVWWGQTDNAEMVQAQALSQQGYPAMALPPQQPVFNNGALGGMF